MNQEEFKDLIEEFVEENFFPEGLCEHCSDSGVELHPDDYRGSYDKAINMLFNAITNTSLKAIINNK